ncbi:MAG: PD-(D/E)XK nuclease family protein [Chloroflexi bacterium]|nr:PD-(D/E)XK nuclease family protein [Chloroflexota bacterium]
MFGRGGVTDTLGRSSDHKIARLDELIAVIEGFIDLLYEEEDGLVLVDYKTDAVGTTEELEARAGQYRVQMGGYAYSLMQATGKPVKEAVLLFLEPKDEYVFTDVDELVAEAKSAAEKVLPQSVGR